MNVILLLGGSSTRLNMNIPKQFIKVKNRELFLYSLDKFYNNKNIKNIVVVTNKEYLTKTKKILKEYNVSVIEGGKTRASSVLNGLKKLRELGITPDSSVLVHDSVRILFDETIIEDLTLEKEMFVSTYIKVYDSVGVTKSGYLSKLLDRDEIVRIATPSKYNIDIIYNLLLNNKSDIDDISRLLIKNGYKIKLIESNSDNIKVTTKKDLDMVKKLL